MPPSEITSTFDRPYRPAAIAFVNRVGRVLSGVGIGGKPITVDGVLSDARRKMGLSDFGDEGFLDALEVLADSINREAALNPGVEDACRNQGVVLLVDLDRLLLERERLFLDRELIVDELGRRQVVRAL